MASKDLRADLDRMFAKPSNAEVNDAWSGLKRMWGRAKDAAAEFTAPMPEVDAYDPNSLPNEQLAGEGLSRLGKAYLAMQPSDEDAPTIGHMPDGSPIRMDPTGISGVMGTVKKVAKAGAKKAGALAMDEASRLKRARKMGFDTSNTYYHGTKADIVAFDPAALGASTNAGSAKQGFFFATDPSTASDYAGLSPERQVLRGKADSKKVGKDLEDFEAAMSARYGETKMNFGQGPMEHWTNKASPEELSQYESLKKQYDQIDDLGVDRKRAIWKLEEELDWYKRNGPTTLKSYHDQLKVGIANLENILSGKVVEKFPRPKEYLESKIAENRAKLAEVAAQIKDTTPKKWKAELGEIETELSRLRDEHSLGDSLHANVLPVHLKTKNPYVHDFKGEAYRDVSYSEIMTKAKELGHDSVIFKNTYDPADPYNRVMQDIIAVFEPNQIRSKFAKFDPKQAKSGNLSAGIAGAATLGAGAALAGSNEASADMFAPPTKDEWSDFMKSKPTRKVEK